MTPNIASPVFNTLLFFFYLVIVVGAAVGAFAAIQLAKAQKRYELDEAEMLAGSGDVFAVAETQVVEAPYADPAPAMEYDSVSTVVTEVDTSDAQPPASDAPAHIEPDAEDAQ